MISSLKSKDISRNGDNKYKKIPMRYMYLKVCKYYIKLSLTSYNNHYVYVLKIHFKLDFNGM